jgi:hypothetical protein
MQPKILMFHRPATGYTVKVQACRWRKNVCSTLCIYRQLHRALKPEAIIDISAAVRPSNLTQWLKHYIITMSK